MKKSIYVLLTLSLFAAFLFGGCSEQMSTTPTDSSTTLEKIAVSGTTDVLIGFTSGNRPDAAFQTAGVSIKKAYKHFPVVFASVPVSAIENLKKNPNVLYVENNMVREISAQVLDWGVDRIDAEYVHAAGNRGAGINVAVLDTGGDMDHPDLTWAGGISVVDKDPTYFEDKNGHGTHCSGIISANDNTIGVVGVAPACNIYMVQVSARSSIYVSDILEGVDWCVGTHEDSDPNNDIMVMSMSFGGPGSDAEKAAMQVAYDDGILLIAAAGNESGAVSAPANYSFIMAISASTSTDAFASYSNFGPEIDIIAPGSYIYSTYKRGGYTTMSGTSMACPMAAGSAAVAWAAHPNYTNDQIRDLLKSTAEDIGLTVYQQGSGLVDVEKAALGTTNGDN